MYMLLCILSYAPLWLETGSFHVNVHELSVRIQKVSLERKKQNDALEIVMERVHVWWNIFLNSLKESGKERGITEWTGTCTCKSISNDVWKSHCIWILIWYWKWDLLGCRGEEDGSKNGQRIIVVLPLARLSSSGLAWPALWWYSTIISIPRVGSSNAGQAGRLGSQQWTSDEP